MKPKPGNAWSGKDGNLVTDDGKPERENEMLKKYDELTEEMKANVLEVLAREINFMHENNEMTKDSEEVKEIASEYMYQVNGTEWFFE